MTVSGDRTMLILPKQLLMLQSATWTSNFFVNEVNEAIQNAVMPNIKPNPIREKKKRASVTYNI